jgi:alkylation response protein AidB-like acyl-CoA dehydrogenase
MRLAESPEQQELRASVRRFLADKSPSSAVREQMETVAGYDAAVWKQLSGQLGLCALAIPEAYGGAGFTFVEQCIVLEEMGKTLYCGPYLASAVLASAILLGCDDEGAKQRYLPGIASGETIATLAAADDSGEWDGGASGLSGQSGPDGWRLNGHKNFVLDGHQAGLILVTAQTAEDVLLFAVDGHAAGLTATVLPTLDQTRRLARLEFDGVAAEPIGPAASVVSATLDVAALALAAEQLGGAQAALDMAVEYAKVRHQFNRPIGSFQAIKHKCADLLLQVESARSAVTYGAWCVAEGSEEVPIVAPLTKAYASETFFHAAAENIQIHGGIGFTWEHDAHLYFKRAKANELLFGDPTHHRERLARRIGI